MDEAQIEADYKKELEANGVELPVDDSAESEQAEETPEKEPSEAPKAEEAEEAEKPLEVESKEVRKRSIYDDYKDKKHDLKVEQEAREQLEKENEELRRRLDEYSQSNDSEHKSAPVDLMEYAEQVGADPELIRRIVEFKGKEAATPIDSETARRLENFEQWQKQNAHILEKQMFEEEFNKTIPALQTMFSGANAEELGAIKTELDKLAHMPGMHDKELEYVAFKHKDRLSALVSPRIKGMESRGRNQVDDTPMEWNPNADLTQMTAKQLEAWEAEYNKAAKSDGSLVGSGKNRRML